jgi:hypothetical protein
MTWTVRLGSLLVCISCSLAWTREEAPPPQDRRKEILDLAKNVADRGFPLEDRVAAAEELAKHGPAAKDAVPALAACLKEERPGYAPLRKAAVNALAAIGPDAKGATDELLQGVGYNAATAEFQMALIHALDRIGAITEPKVLRRLRLAMTQAMKEKKWVDQPGRYYTDRAGKEWWHEPFKGEVLDRPADLFCAAVIRALLKNPSVTEGMEETLLDYVLGHALNEYGLASWSDGWQQGIDLLGKIGSAEARRALRSIARSTEEGKAKAARAALDRLMQP